MADRTIAEIVNAALDKAKDGGYADFAMNEEVDRLVADLIDCDAEVEAAVVADDGTFEVEAAKVAEVEAAVRAWRAAQC